jgi:hypothetical protein
MIRYRCENCGNECDIIEYDDGGYEEIWGARIWHPQPTDYSDCCKEDFTEMTAEDIIKVDNGEEMDD